MKQKEIESIKKVIPFVGYDEETQCFVSQDGSYMNLYRIVPRDLVNSDVDEIEMDCFKWAKFYKTYGMDVGITTMMFPADTRIQQNYWRKKERTNQNPAYRDMLKRKVEELQYREKHTATKEFFLSFIFATREEICDAVKVIDSTLGIGVQGMLEEIEKEKKLQILFKLGNKNSMIF